MKKRLITVAVTAFLASAGASLAGDPSIYADDPTVSQIAAQLAVQGYVIVDIEKTLLGRLKIEAVADGFKREIVINSFTGQVLRDEWEAETSASADGLDSNNDGIADTSSENEVETEDSGSRDLGLGTGATVGTDDGSTEFETPEVETPEVETPEVETPEQPEEPQQPEEPEQPEAPETESEG